MAATLIVMRILRLKGWRSRGGELHRQVRGSGYLQPPHGTSSLISDKLSCADNLMHLLALFRDTRSAPSYSRLVVRREEIPRGVPDPEASAVHQDVIGKVLQELQAVLGGY
jgi:hypothetical protein